MNIEEMNIEELSKRMYELDKAEKRGLTIFIDSPMPAYVISDIELEKKKGYLETLTEINGEWTGMVRYPDNNMYLTSIKNILCDGMMPLIEWAKKNNKVEDGT